MTKSTTFAVDAVEKNEFEVSTTTSRAALEKVLGGTIESCSAPDAIALEPIGFNVFFEALHRAYDDHHSLVLSPDDIWLTIAQGFAAIVAKDPEKYRSCFVSHEGKEEIVVQAPGFGIGRFENDWTSVFGKFSKAILERVGEENHAMIVSDFSTTGIIEKAASEVVLMDVLQSYFEYVVFTDCGIPSVTLLGTPEDWDKLVAKTRALAKFEDTAWWLDHVHPIVEQFARASKGDVDLTFWQNIYKGLSMSGGITASGNLLRLMPFIKAGEQKIVNPLLAVTGADGEDDPYRPGGISTSMMVQALSNVPFKWQILGQELDMQFLAGHVAISYDAETNSLRPIIGWAVRPTPVAESATEETPAAE